MERGLTMVPGHPRSPEFAQRLASALNISPCRHEPDFPRTVPILREMGLDVSSTLHWFHGWGMKCDCAILDRGDDWDGRCPDYPDCPCGRDEGPPDGGEKIKTLEDA